MIENFVTNAAKEIPSGSTVLDAGAGECRFASLFSHCRYMAIDFAKGDPKWNYKRLSMLGDLLSLPLKNGSVDVIICTQTLEHVNDPDILLKELYRALKSGGRLYLTAPLGWPIHQAPYDFFRFTHYGLEHLLKKFGFTVEFIRPQGGYFLYLGNCLQHMHRVLFPTGRPFLKRFLLFPLQFFTVVFAAILAPLTLYFLDQLDEKREFTLNYECRCQKREESLKEYHWNP
ncbi:MAG: class I SAM-dependent methyltransferase [Syntrophales bacterium]